MRCVERWKNHALRSHPTRRPSDPQGRPSHSCPSGRAFTLARVPSAVLKLKPQGIVMKPTKKRLKREVEHLARLYKKSGRGRAGLDPYGRRLCKFYRRLRFAKTTLRTSSKIAKLSKVKLVPSSHPLLVLIKATAAGMPAKSAQRLAQAMRFVSRRRGGPVKILAKFGGVAGCATRFAKRNKGRRYHRPDFAKRSARRWRSR